MIGLNGVKVELVLVKKMQMMHHQGIFIVMVFQLAQIGLKKMIETQCMVMFSSMEMIMLTLEVMAPISIQTHTCLLYTSPSPRDISGSRMPSSA